MGGKSLKRSKRSKRSRRSKRAQKRSLKSKQSLLSKRALKKSMQSGSSKRAPKRSMRSGGGFRFWRHDVPEADYGLASLLKPALQKEDKPFPSIFVQKPQPTDATTETAEADGHWEKVKKYFAEPAKCDRLNAKIKKLKEQHKNRCTKTRNLT